MIDIILAEDHNIVRDGIKSLLQKESNFRVVAEATNGLEILQKITDGLKADILLTDLNMPELSGMDLIVKLKEIAPEIKIIVLSMLDHEDYVAQAFNAGAVGFMLKSISRAELVFAINHVSSGASYICSELSLKILNNLSFFRSNSSTEQKAIAELTKREIEVLRLISDGFTNQEISDKLFTSKRTVEGHRQNLIEKSGARNTATLIRFALQNGIIR